jgi:transposase
MTSWTERARQLRAENAPLSEIAARVGKSKSAVFKAVKDTAYVRAAWRATARQMRSEGATIPEIMKAVGRSEATVYEAVLGVPFARKVKTACSKPRVRKRATPIRDLWREHRQKAREMRMNGASIEEIVIAYDRSASWAWTQSRGIKIDRPRKKMARPALRKPKPRLERPVQTPPDPFLVFLRQAVGRDQATRRLPAITLPRIMALQEVA